MKLTFYLFDETLEGHTSVFLPGKLEGPYPFVPVPLTEPNEDIAVYLQRNKPSTPSWIGFFGAHCDFGDHPPIRNQHNSLVVVIRVPDGQSERYFALTAGFGHLALDKNRIEDDFGLTVTLNTVHQAKLRGMEARDLGSRTQQKRLMISYEAQVWNFDFDPDREIVGKMDGTPEDADFGDFISGADSLALFRTIRWSQLEEICRDLLGHYGRLDYEERFQFAALQRRVKNKSKVAELDLLLSDALRERTRDRISLALPISEVDRVAESALLSHRHPTPIYLYPLSIDSLYSALDLIAADAPDPRQLTLEHWDADGAYVERKSLYKHLLFEVRRIEAGGRERVYVFSMGTWFSLAPQHVAFVRERVAAVPVLNGNWHFPDMQWIPRPDGTVRLETEGEYNTRVAGVLDMALFDCNLFRQNLPGYGRIEVCDLLAADGRFFCVKKYGGSSDLSHLFSQGGVSADLFYHMPEYRHFTAVQVNNGWAVPFDPDNDRPNGLKLVYAIACPERFELPHDLPFFSQVNLLTFRKKVRPLGFEVELAKIAIPAPPGQPAPGRGRRRPRQNPNP
jgi:uncharacterized protein (TIGR04141 family)